MSFVVCVVLNVTKLKSFRDDSHYHHFVIVHDSAVTFADCVLVHFNLIFIRVFERPRHFKLCYTPLKCNTPKALMILFFFFFFYFLSPLRCRFSSPFYIFLDPAYHSMSCGSRHLSNLYSLCLSFT